MNLDEELCNYARRTAWIIVYRLLAVLELRLPAYNILILKISNNIIY